MANYTQLIRIINDNIKANGNQEITGPVLNAVLQVIVKELSKGALFAGIANTTTNPPAYDGNVFYLAIEPGTYSNFGVIVPNGSIGIISNRSSDWKVTLIRIVSQELGDSEDVGVSQKVITKLLQTKTDNTLQTTDKTVAGAINEVNQAVKNKQDKTDKSLQTTDKTVAGAINEVNQAVKTKQDKLKPGTGVEITSDNTVNVTLDTTVFKVVASLPESPAAGDENKIHLVPAESTEEGNIYTEYVFVNGKWEEFGTYRSEVDLAQYLKSTEAEATYQKITDSTLATTAKTIVGAINEVNTDLKSAVEPYVVDLTNLLAAQDSQSISTAIGGIDNLNGTVQKNQVIFGTLANGTVAVGIRVLGNKTTLTYFVDSVVGLTVNEVIITNTSGTLTKTANTHAVLTENMVVNSLDSDETTLPLSAAQGKVLKEDVEVNSYMQYLHKVYEEYGAVYNADTGYWELNGLTDLTEEDMWVIYLAGVPRTNDLTEFYAESSIVNKSIRTTFNYVFKGGGTGTGTILRGTFMQCANLEVVQPYKSEITPIFAKELLNAFYNCQKLRKIVNILQVYSSTLSTNNTFYNCKALESVKLSRLRTDISFKDSPLLSYESIKYLVDNAANTEAITVTVHPTTYSYLTGTTPPTAEVGGTTEEWQALVTTAQGKQISFAVPEETQNEVTE